MGLLPEGASLYDPANILLVHHLMAALRAHNLFHKDQQYVVQPGDGHGEVVIVDEFTGRLMVGRRWSDGLHQAVEAKEGVKIQNENQTLASITFQNYFRMYGKLAGMTGTADTEAYEFQEIYNLETVVLPPNKPSARGDKLDQVYKTAGEKYNAIIMDIEECRQRGQPVLVGTTSIENSELLSGLLKKKKFPHEVLNAKQHAREAEIIMQAGAPGAVTIATNMAGRGTDIVLGGNVEKQIDFLQADESRSADDKAAGVEQLRNAWQGLHDQVVAAGGLHIVGTERHESRRVDNQLRGRSGRQGDPGSSRFYLSLDDPLLRIFAGDRVRAIMDRLKMPEGEPIEAGIVMRSIETAQRKVEARNFDIRKQLLEYDDVANDQRKVIYQPAQRAARVARHLRDHRVAAPRRVHERGPHLRARGRDRGTVGPGRPRARPRVRVAAARAAGRDAREGGNAVGRRRDRARAEGGRRVVRREDRDRRQGGVRRLRAVDHAAEPRLALARAPRRAGPSAAGHPPARLRAEESEAGIQARGVRAVLGAAGRDRQRGHALHLDGAGADAGADHRRRGADGDRGAGARERALPARRL